MSRRRQTAFSTRVHLVEGHQLVLLEGGSELFPALVEAMDAARRVVHLETYIFQFAGTALTVADALERAALRGVLVRLVVDGVGTPRIPMEWQQRFAKAGVRWHIYAPLGRLGLLIPSSWRRLHRKLCVVDETVGFCGGINIIDDLDDVALGRLEVPRLDFTLRIAGPLVSDMVISMESLWWRLQAVRKARQREFKMAWQALKTTLPSGDFTQILRLFATTDDRPMQASGVFEAPSGTGGVVGVDGAVAALLLRDNLIHRHDIERAYLKAIGEARHDIVIANAYFVPGRKLRRALTMAAQRGVRVRLLVQGRYENFFQYHAARPVHQTLVTAGIEIQEYAPSALHAKVAVVDQRWATVGSTNLDPLSLLLAREANILTTDERFAQMLHRRLDVLVTQSRKSIDVASLRQRPRLQKMLDGVAFAIMRMVLFLTGHRY
jgi:cardiolipin synthase